MTGRDLPTTVSVKETSYRIHADYRDILGVLEQLNDPENAGAIGIYVALNLFYEDFQALLVYQRRRGGIPGAGHQAHRLGAGPEPHRRRRQPGGRRGGPGASALPLVDVPCMVPGRGRRAAFHSSGHPGKAPEGKGSGSMGTGLLPGKPGKGRF